MLERTQILHLILNIATFNMGPFHQLVMRLVDDWAIIRVASGLGCIRLHLSTQNSRQQTKRVKVAVSQDHVAIASIKRVESVTEQGYCV